MRVLVFVMILGIGLNSISIEPAFSEDEVIKKVVKKTVVRYKKKTKVDLDASVIEGDVLDPNRMEITVQPEERFGKMLEPRKDFLKEVRSDVDFIR